MIVQNVVNDIMSSVTYVISLEGSNSVWLVDCGAANKIMDIVGDRTISGILLTHVHYDHIYGITNILKLYPDCKVYTNMDGIRGLCSTTLNLSKYFNDPILVDCNNIKRIMEGDAISLFPSLTAEVYETPGHNPSCICFKINDYFFTGDAYIPGYKPVTNFHEADKEMAYASMKRIMELAKGSIICAGHV